MGSSLHQKNERRRAVELDLLNRVSFIFEVSSIPFPSKWSTKCMLEWYSIRLPSLSSFSFCTTSAANMLSFWASKDGLCVGYLID